MRRADRNREIYAEALEAQGPAWKRAADNVRAGYTNVWIEAGLKAVDAAYWLGAEDADAEGDEST